MQPLEILNWTQASVRFKLSIRKDGSLRELYGIYTDLAQTQNRIRETFVSKGYLEVEWSFDEIDKEYWLQGNRPPEEEVLNLAQIEMLDQRNMRSLEIWLEEHSSDMDPENNIGFEGLGSLFG